MSSPRPDHLHHHHQFATTILHSFDDQILRLSHRIADIPPNVIAVSKHSNVHSEICSFERQLQREKIIIFYGIEESMSKIVTLIESLKFRLQDLLSVTYKSLILTKPRSSSAKEDSRKIYLGCFAALCTLDTPNDEDNESIVEDTPVNESLVPERDICQPHMLPDSTKLAFQSRTMRKRKHGDKKSVEERKKSKKDIFDF